VTPVVFAWVEQLRQAYEGQALVRNGSEMMVLDAPFSGQLFFDANTGKISVSSYSANSVEDQTSCSPYTLSGFPLYGLNPGCRDIGQNPDRAIGVVRPVMGNQGFLYAHNREIPAGPGLKPEITPREIDPAVLPETPPADLRYLAFRRVPASNDCNPATLEWYESTGLLPVGIDDLDTTTVTYTELQDVTKAFNFLVTRLVNDQWVTYRLTNESFKELIDQGSTSSLTWLSIPHTALFQHVSNTSFPGFGATYYPAISDPVISPIVPQSTVVNLAALQGYTPQATWVLLDFRLKGQVGGSNAGMNATLVANAREYARVAASNTWDTCYSQVMVPIPSNKLLPVNLYLYSVGNPTSNYLYAQVGHLKWSARKFHGASCVDVSGGELYHQDR
jgi:hypothetical protein